MSPPPAPSAAETTDLLRELVEIESPSTDPDGVAALAERIAGWLRPLGVVADLEPVAGAGPILRARLGGPGRPVMLLGHLDTVWPIGTLAARPVRIEQGRLYGPGAYDMKAGIVVALLALRALHTARSSAPVLLYLTPLEEVDNEPYRERMEDEMRGCAAVLGFEPAWPGGAVKTSRKGSGSFVLRARGRAAHAGAAAEMGASAIVELAEQVLAVSALRDAARGVSVNVGVIRGGVRPNVVPDLAEAEIDVRYVARQDGDALVGALRSLQPRTPGVTLELDGALHYPPLERGPHVARVYEAAREVAAGLGQELAEVATGGASEASFAAALGVPTLDGLGGDGDGAHALDEHVVLDSLPGRTALAAGLIERLAGSAG